MRLSENLLSLMGKMNGEDVIMNYPKNSNQLSPEEEYLRGRWIWLKL